MEQTCNLSNKLVGATARPGGRDVVARIGHADCLYNGT